MAPGGRFGATCAAYERRVAECTVTLEKPSEGGPFHNASPIVNVRHFPRLSAGEHDSPAVHELVRALSRDRAISEVWEGIATLDFFGAPHEEHTTLAPIKLGRGYRFSFGYTVDDLETVKDLGLSWSCDELATACYKVRSSGVSARRE